MIIVIFEIDMGKNQLLTVNKPASANRNKYLKRKFEKKHEIGNHYELHIYIILGNVLVLQMNFFSLS